MRFIIALVLSIVAVAPAGAGDLFSRTELRCEIKHGGKWDFGVEPPELKPMPPAFYRIHAIDLDAQIAHSGPDYDASMVAVRGSRSIVFARKATTLIVLAKPEIPGFPAIFTSVEIQRSGYCR